MVNLGHWRQIRDLRGRIWGPGGWFKDWRAALRPDGVILGLEGWYGVWGADPKPEGLILGLDGLIWGQKGWFEVWKGKNHAWDSRYEGQEASMASGMRGRNYIQMNGWTDIRKFTPMFRPDFRASPMLSVLLLGSHILRALSPADFISLRGIWSAQVDRVKWFTFWVIFWAFHILNHTMSDYHIIASSNQ